LIRIESKRNRRQVLVDSRLLAEEHRILEKYMAQDRILKVTGEFGEGEMKASALLEEALKSTAPHVVVTFATLEELQRELGSMDETVQYIFDLATRYQKPIGVNLPGAGGTSQTSVIAPNGWSTAKVACYIGTAHSGLDQMFVESKLE